MNKNKIYTIYDTNEVMRLIGKQGCADFITDDFKAALDAHNRVAEQLDIISIALNFYVLGVITGKRLDRAERSRREFVSFTESAAGTTAREEG